MSALSIDDLFSTPAARATEAALGRLLTASRHRNRTVQFMPRDSRGPDRAEIIICFGERAGDFEAIVDVQPDGSLRIRESAL